MIFDLHIRVIRDHFVVVPRGDLDLDTAPALRLQLTQLVDRADRVVVDLSRLTFLDSSGLSVLVDSARRARQRGAVLHLAAPSAIVLKLLRVTGVHARLPVFADVKTATRAGRLSA